MKCKNSWMFLLPDCGPGLEWVCFQCKSEDGRRGDNVHTEISYEALHSVHKQKDKGDRASPCDG